MDKEATAKDLFLAFCEKSGIEVDPNNDRITLFDGVRMVDFSFKEDGSFIEYDIG